MDGVRALSMIKNWDKALPRLQCLTIRSPVEAQPADLLFNATFAHLETFHLELGHKRLWKKNSFLRVFAPFLERHDATLKTLRIDGSWTGITPEPLRAAGRGDRVGPRKPVDITLRHLHYFTAPYHFFTVANCAFPSLKEICIDWTAVHRMSLTFGEDSERTTAHCLTACKSLQEATDEALELATLSAIPFISHHHQLALYGRHSAEISIFKALAATDSNLRVLSLDMTVCQKPMSEYIRDALHSFKSLEIILLHAWLYDNYWVDRETQEQCLGMWSAACPTLRACTLTGHAYDAWAKQDSGAWEYTSIQHFPRKAGIESWLGGIRLGGWDVSRINHPVDVEDDSE
ncbi:hypothetical protein C8F01DRAFT_1137947 [Mycena amicta]|nr:hypothetical protein C8F01DRAFT_1137947 [Mycena amicta]